MKEKISLASGIIAAMAIIGCLTGLVLFSAKTVIISFVVFVVSAVVAMFTDNETYCLPGDGL